jgi:carboxymethylenebutenolidase
VGSDHFDAYLALPPSGRGPGLLLFQEIFGINDNMRTLAGRLAEAGYVVLVPDMFWRIERRFERSDDSGMADAFAMVQRFDLATAGEDIQAAHAHLLSLPECDGRIGAMGFCLGGALAYVAAVSSRVDGHGPDAVVCYYGSAINDLLGEVDQLQAPALFHYGARDDFIPADRIAEVEAAVVGKPGVEFYRYDAGHAFSNEDSTRFYDPRAAAEAWPRTLDFLRRHLLE